MSDCICLRSLEADVTKPQRKVSTVVPEAVDIGISQSCLVNVVVSITRRACEPVL